MVYKIIEFFDGIQLVPVTWLRDNQKECFWPVNEKSQIKINKMIAEMINPDVDDWELCPVKRIMSSSDSFKVGIEKLRLAERYSEIDTVNSDDSSHGMKKSKRHRRSIIYSDGEEEKHERVKLKKSKTFKKISTPTSSTSKEIRYPSFPKTFDKLSSNSESEPSTSAEEYFKTSELKKTNSKKENSTQLTFNTQPILKSVIKNINQTSSFNSQFEIETGHLEKFNKTIARLVVKINSMQDQIFEMDNKLDKIMNLVITNNKIANMDIDEQIQDDFVLPIKIENELIDTEILLKEDFRFYTRMVNKLKIVGGTGTNSVICNILKTIMTDNLATMYSFAGKRQKKSFKDTLPTFMKIIIEVGRYHKNSATNEDIYSIISKWLVQATLRKTRSDIKHSTPAVISSA